MVTNHSAEMAGTLLTIDQFSELAGIPVNTLRLWRTRGDYGPKSARIGRRVMYRRADVDAWIDEQFANGGA